MKRTRTVLLLFAFGLLLSACSTPDVPTNVRGMKPIYISKNLAFDIGTENPRVMNQPGKIYIMGGYLFIVEKSQGVHVIDNSDPENPVKLKFIRIPGVIDVAVKGHTLFADNITDLVALDISNVNDVKISKRIKDVYPIVNQLYPTNYSGYFECADTTKGFVIGWEETDLNHPKCYRNGGDGLLFNE